MYHLLNFMRGGMDNAHPIQYLDIFGVWCGWGRTDGIFAPVTIVLAHAFLTNGTHLLRTVDHMMERMWTKKRRGTFIRYGWWPL